MKVDGNEICEIEITKLRNEMLRSMGDCFRFHNLKTAARYQISNELNEKNLDRLCDRLVQRWKKDGYITFKFNRWNIIKQPFEL